MTAVHAAGMTALIRIGHCDCRAIGTAAHQAATVSNQSAQGPCPMKNQLIWLERLFDGRRDVERTMDATRACKAGAKLQQIAPPSTRLQVTLPVEQMDVTAPMMNANRAGRAVGVHQLAGADDSSIAALNVAAGASMARNSGEIMGKVFNACPIHQPAP